MRTDVVDLRKFYESSLGKMGRELILRQVRSLWPNVTNQNLIGIGYAAPYLKSFLNDASRVINTMPTPQGALYWPQDAKSLTTLVEELELPFEDLSIDKVLVIHALEYTEQTQTFLREIWRLLNGNGRIIVIVPNRRGLWTHFEHTPFGRGLPYSSSQLSKLLRANMFSPTQTRNAIFMPPTRSKFLMPLAPSFERIGSNMFSNFAGVVIIEAIKQIYAGQPVKQANETRPVIALPQRSQRILERK